MNSVVTSILIFGALGVIGHVLIKVQSINSDLQTTNYRLVFTTYWKYDWVTVLISILVVIVAAFTSNEWLPVAQIAANDQKPTPPATLVDFLLQKISSLIKLTSFTIGLVADYLLANWLSVTKAKLKAKAIAEGANPGDIMALPSDKIKPAK